MSNHTLFPQITRFFSAFILWLALGTLITLNIVNASSQFINVLGTTTEFEEIALQQQEQIEQTRVRYLYWQEIINEKPDYRDAYITSAALAYQLSDVEKAKYYLDFALRLDPNNSEVVKLSSLLE